MMFRRKPSPRQETKGRSQSSGVFQQNGHRRQDSDSDFVGYGDPDHISGSRSRAVTSPTTEFNPQLGGSAGGASEDVESAVYVTPADTLNRGTPSSIIKTNSAANQGSSSSGDNFAGTRHELQNMQLHQLTLSQVSRRNQSGSGEAAPAPSPSGVKERIQMMEGSDYSVPFNLLQGDIKKGRRHGPPQPGPPDNSECIIAINPHSSSPQSPSDRSDTTSPNSPRSNLSSEHEQLPPPPPQRPPDDGDYAVPWDRSRIFQNIQRASMSNVRRHPRRRNDDFEDPGSGPSRSRGGSLRDQPSPPLPLPQSRHPMGGRDINQVPPPPPPPPEESPPPPELPHDPNRWRNRTVSEQFHDNSLPGGKPQNRAAALAAEDFGGRSQSMSGQVGPGRRGGGNGNPWRNAPATIDPLIPLEDQPWYHGSLKRADAEDKLRDQSDFSFLVRKSESCQTDFSLSIRDMATGCIHLRLVYEEEPSPGYVLGQFSRHFDKVTDCIAFYTKQRLNIRGAEHKRLGYPVPRTHAMDKYHNSLATVGV